MFATFHTNISSPPFAGCVFVKHSVCSDSNWRGMGNLQKTTQIPESRKNVIKEIRGWGEEETQTFFFPLFTWITTDITGPHSQKRVNSDLAQGKLSWSLTSLNPEGERALRVVRVSSYLNFILCSGHTRFHDGAVFFLYFLFICLVCVMSCAMTGQVTYLWIWKGTPWHTIHKHWLQV